MDFDNYHRWNPFQQKAEIVEWSDDTVRIS